MTGRGNSASEAAHEVDELTRALGNARVKVKRLASDLVQQIEMAEFEEQPALKTRMALNKAAGQLADAVKDYGRLLP